MRRDGTTGVLEDVRARTLAALTLVAVIALTAGPLASTAGAHAGADAVTIEARESGCPGDREFCYEVTHGSLEDVSGGDQVEFTFVNPEGNSINHNLHVAKLSEADTGGNTDAGDAYASTEDVAPGNQTTLSAQIPAGADGVYLWCDVGAHEARGMYTEVRISSASDGSDGSDGSENSSPGLGTAVGLAALAGVAVAARRR